VTAQRPRAKACWKVGAAARLIKQGAIVAYPTEAVYGLGCDPSDASAVARLLAIKHRPSHNGLILVAAHRAQLDPWLDTVPAKFETRLRRSWPGPTTWLVPAADSCPAWLTGAHPTLAVRVSAHPLIRALCNRLGSALVSTSANVHGRPPARSILEVQLRFAAAIDFILGGPLGGRQRPSTIRDLASGRILRP